MQRRFLSLLLSIALLFALALEPGARIALAEEGEADSTTTTDSASEAPVASETSAPSGGFSLRTSSVTIQPGTQNFDLLSLATATSLSGKAPVIKITDDGGFNADVEGKYQITFMATDPGSGLVSFAACTVTVAGPRVSTATGLTGTSDERYEMFKKYRDSISGELQNLISQLNAALAERIGLLESAFPEVTGVQLYHVLSADTGNEDGAATVETLASADSPKIANWAQILAVFVAKSSLNVDEPLDLYNLRQIRLSGVKDVFWNMLELSYRVENGTLSILLRERTSEEMAQIYGFGNRRNARLNDLMQPEFQRLFASLTGDVSFADMSQQQAAAIRAQLPAGLSLAREKVVIAAHSLVGQVNYFWGGKYAQVGWNPLWGVPKVVTASGSETTGTIRGLGLDCSGFVNWVFVNAAGDESVASVIGYGSENQWNNSRTLGWDEAQPGDLAFRSIPGTTATNHVGVVVEKRADGTYLVAHCSSSKNTVVITEAWSSGFRYMRRPILYD